MGQMFSTFSTKNPKLPIPPDPLHLHKKSRGYYSEPQYSYAMNLSIRSPVSDNLVPWRVRYDDYKPVNFTANEVLKQPVWADPKNPKEIKDQFNLGKRISHMPEKYKISEKDGSPINPIGRTGMTGRGLLGKWGPNHAADPLVTRIKPNCRVISGKPRIEFIAIRRRDNGEWAIPGGMVEAGDTISLTLKKEFHEEAQNILKLDPIQAARLQANTKKLFDNPTTQLYKGYVGHRGRGCGILF